MRYGLDEPWRAEATCRPGSGHDPDLWFIERGDEGYREARAICRTCPVQVACLEYALDNHIVHGMWGGQSVRERERIVRSRANARRAATG